ncbi:MAG: TRAP transporter large permease subunit [Pseudomonadota bacterium]
MFEKMDIGTITALIVLSLFVLMLLGMPLGVATLTVSIGTALLNFGVPGLFLVSSNVYGILEKYPLVAVPLFVMMASILERIGVARDLFTAMSIFAGNMRGGVAVQTTLVGVVLAAMSGVIGGEIVMLGLIALPQMLRLGYDPKLSIGIICASGSLATLIPPSIVLIVYGLSAQVSISDLFVAGIAPGILLATFYICYVLLIVRVRPHLAPLPSEVGEATGFTPEERKAIIRGVILPVLVVFMVMGSIYGGIASVTEAAGIGVFGALISAAVRKRLTWDMLQTSLRQTAVTVGSIIWLIMGAVSLVGIYNVIGGTRFLQDALSGLEIAPVLVILIMMGILLVLGTFMEWVAIVFITVPIFAPVVVELGYDPVWFGILFTMNLQIYYLSPPFGPACFWLKSVAPPEITLQQIFASVWPFIGLQLVGLTLVLFFPEIVLFLPRLLNG